MKRISLFLFATLFVLNVVAQIKWYNPTEAGFPVIQHQGWVGEERENPYHRFPLRAKESVRKSVWSLSRHNAGECIKFTTNARQIIVRYTVEGGRAMAHMPATGVSGVDLYTQNRHGKELWVAARYSMGDTIRYNFGIDSEPLDFDDNSKRPHTYTLYLPLYNTVKWMEIGIKDGDKFDFEPLSEERPIVAYGTSITHGACASRPGMAWSNILNRRMGHPVYNIGFSGNAYFEKEVINLLGELDAKAYILDALPNSHSIKPAEALRDTIVKAVRQLRSLRPNAPILLADHLGYPHGNTLKVWNERAGYANQVQKEAYEQLISEGFTDLYHLTYEEIGMPQDATVEAIHPSDYGMQVYADAYEKKMREILNEPQGTHTTTVPVAQNRDSYHWPARHAQIIKAGREGGHFKRVIIGNSIVHYWGGLEGLYKQNGAKSWNKHLKGTLNMGCGWDKIENVLWRVYHDELDNFTADHIYLMIGTNNIGKGGNKEELLAGIRQLAEAIRVRRPEARLKLVGLFPRRGKEAFVQELNVALANLATGMGLEFRNPGTALLLENGKIDEALFTDGLHPNEKGYEKVVAGFTE